MEHFLISLAISNVNWLKNSLKTCNRNKLIKPLWSPSFFSNLVLSINNSDVVNDRKQNWPSHVSELQKYFIIESIRVNNSMTKQCTE